MAELLDELRSGASPEVDQSIGQAKVLLTSGLSRAEAARVLMHLPARGVSDVLLADAARLDSVWERCAIWDARGVRSDAARVV